MIHKRNELLAKVLIRNLASRHMNAYYCHTSKEAVQKVLSLMPQGSSVGWGGSMTIRDMGLIRALEENGTYRLLDREKLTDREEIMSLYREMFSADFYLTSVNAISQKGEIVNIDGNGNRVAAITFGPRQVIFLVGMNKVVSTLEDALERARTIAAPINCQRFATDTPCHQDGVCHSCLDEMCICNYVEVLRNSRPAFRHTVILVDESLGY